MRTGEDDEASPVLDEAFRLDAFNVWVYNLRQMVKRDRREYVGVDTRRLALRVWEKDRPTLGAMAENVVDELLEKAEAMFGYTIPRTVKLSYLKSQPDFSARITGLPGLAASVAAFGPFVAVLSPFGARTAGMRFDWQSTTLHELAHSVTLLASNYRLPRWLGEGMSVYAEGAIETDWDIPLKTLVASGNLPDLATWNRMFNRPEHGWQVPASYHAAGRFVEWLVEDFGADTLPKLLQRFAAGDDTDVAFLAVMGKTIPELNAWFHARLVPYAETIDLPPLGNPGSRAELEKRLAENPDDNDAAVRLLRIYQHADRRKVASFAEELFARVKEAESSADRTLRDEAAVVFASATLMKLDARILAALEELQEGSAEAAVKKNADEALAILDAGGDEGRWAFVYFLRGVVKGRMGDAAGAEADWRRAVERHPRFVQRHPLFGNPYRLLVKRLVAEEKTAEAADFLEQYARTARSDVAAWRELAALRETLGDGARAAEAYARATAVDPYRREDYEALERLYRAAGRDTDADRARKIANALPKSASGGVPTGDAPKERDASTSDDDDENDAEPAPGEILIG